MEITYTSNSDARTKLLGEKLAKGLEAGTFIALDGELGAGKTVFVKGFAKGLGITEDILSPTFTLLRSYEGKNKLYHFDVYRIEEEDELAEIGFEEYIQADGITIVEWANRIPGFLPEDRISIKIQYAGCEQDRTIQITCAKKYESAVKAAAAC